MRRRTYVVLIVVGLVVALIGSAQAAVRPPAGSPISSSLEIQKWRHELSDPIALQFSLTNSSSESVWVLRWQTPVDGIDADLFAVERDGVRVPYSGRLIKRAAAEPEDYLEIGAGETITAVVDISAAYDMTRRGVYSVRYRADLVVVQREGKNVGRERELAAAPRPASGSLESNEVTLYVEGLDDTVTDTREMVKPGPGDPTYASCSNTQISQIQTALANAGVISGKAKSHLSANPNGSALYTTWFGTYTSSRFNTVQSHFNSLVSAFGSAPFTFDCGCRQRYYAYVYPNQPYKIYLCRVFWTAPALGYDSQAGTLVHETSHFTVVAGTDDYVYGQTGAKNLAITDPAKAVNNADNHEYFAESQP